MKQQIFGQTIKFGEKSGKNTTKPKMEEEEEEEKEEDSFATKYYLTPAVPPPSQPGPGEMPLYPLQKLIGAWT